MAKKPPPNPRLTLGWSDELRQRWKGELDASKEQRRLRLPSWERHLNDYQPQPKASASGEIKLENNLFSYVEQKKTSLFFRQPEITLRPQEVRQDSATLAIPIHEAVLNHKLKEARVQDETSVALVDALAVAGLMCVEVGFDVRTAPATIEQPILDPLGMPLVDPLGQPIMQPVEVQVPIWERWFWNRIPMWEMLLPAGAGHGIYDELPWIARQWKLPESVVRRQFDLGDEWEAPEHPKPTDTEIERFERNTDNHGTLPKRKEVRGLTIWYRAALVDKKVVHPELLHQLVWLEGDDEPIVHRPSPYQSLDEMGRLTPDSMRGFPYHVGSLREAVNGPYVPPDAVYVEGLIEEKRKYRKLRLRQRIRAIPPRFYNPAMLPPAAVEAMEKGDGAAIPLEDHLPNFDNILRQLEGSVYPKDNIATEQDLEKEIMTTLALGPNQRGQFNTGRRSATEAQIVNQASDLRSTSEQDRVIAWFTAGVAKFDALLQRFATEQQIIEVAGPNGQADYQPWDRTTIAGRFLYEIRPDSQAAPDSAMDRAQWIQLYNMWAKDPQVNQIHLKRRLARAFRLDPAMVVPDPPPPPPPPPPEAEVRLDLGRLDEMALNPDTWLLTLSLLQQQGFALPPYLQQQLATVGQSGPPQAVPAPPVNPGPAQQADVVTRRQMQISGGLPGDGSQVQ